MTFYVELPIKNVQFTTVEIGKKNSKIDQNKSEIDVITFVEGEKTRLEIRKLFRFEDNRLSPVDSEYDDIFLKANFGLGKLFVITLIGFHCLDSFDGILEYINGKFERVLSMKPQTVKNPDYSKIKVKPKSTITGMVEVDVLGQLYNTSWDKNKFTLDVDAINWFMPDKIVVNKEVIELTRVTVWNMTFDVVMPYLEFKELVKRNRTKGL